MLEEGSDQLPKVGELGTIGGRESLIFDNYSFSKKQFDTPSELEGSDQLPKVGEPRTTAGQEDLIFDNYLFSKGQFDTPVSVLPSGSPRGIPRRVVMSRDSPGSEHNGARNTRI